MQRNLNSNRFIFRHMLKINVNDFTSLLLNLFYQYRKAILLHLKLKKFRAAGAKKFSKVLRLYGNHQVFSFCSVYHTRNFTSIPQLMKRGTCRFRSVRSLQMHGMMICSHLANLLIIRMATATALSFPKCTITYRIPKNHQQNLHHHKIFTLR
ncbi:hypothetical protein D3C78_1024560 [compost metagenome]